MSRTQLMAVLLVTTALACQKKETPELEQAPATPAVQPAPVAEKTPAKVDDQRAVLEQVAVQEDFEEQAIAQITPENLDSEIETLEKETSE
jgi:hypothetical protein